MHSSGSVGLEVKRGTGGVTKKRVLDQMSSQALGTCMPRNHQRRELIERNKLATASRHSKIAHGRSPHTKVAAA